MSMCTKLSRDTDAKNRQHCLIYGLEGILFAFLNLELLVVLNTRRSITESLVFCALLGHPSSSVVAPHSLPRPPPEEPH